MNDQELREMVRESIARHRGRPDATVRADAGDARRRARRAHASHRRAAARPSGDEDGACLIEPAVRCNHCGYCLSLRTLEASPVGAGLQGRGCG